jgi:hypothetical protein
MKGRVNGVREKERVLYQELVTSTGAPTQAANMHRASLIVVAMCWLFHWQHVLSLCASSHVQQLSWVLRQ